MMIKKDVVPIRAQPRVAPKEGPYLIQGGPPCRGDGAKGHLTPDSG